MDPTMEEMKFIGSLRIFSQSFKTVFTWKKIFAQITLTLILPLAFFFILHIEISSRLFYTIEKSPYQLFNGAFDCYRSFFNTGATSTDWLNYFLFKLTSIAIVTALSLLSTAAVVYTIACVYTGRDVTFRKSIKVVPKVWKRLTVTLLCMFLTLLAYSLITSVVIFISKAVFSLPSFQNFSFLAISILYIFGFLYLSIVWQLASVVSVLESSYGIKAMTKATDLMNGKTKSALAISILSYQLLTVIVFVYISFVVYNNVSLGLLWRLLIGVICGILLVIMFLLIMVTETVLYLVCKSHHGETIDPLSLTTYLSAYLSNSRPVLRTGEDIQLGRSQNQPVFQVNGRL